MTKDNFSKYIFFTISVGTIYILIYNIFHYTPILGYDGEAHFAYVDHLARYLPRQFNLPTEVDTREFFNPPLAYIFPSFAQVICRNFIESDNFLRDCQPIYGKATQIFQSMLYILTIIINLYVLKIFNHSKTFINASYLLLFSLLAVNYRTISMIRGEPYILFFLSLFLLIIVKNEKNNFQTNIKTILFTSLIIAGIALSRQWGFLLFLPIIYITFFKKSEMFYNHLKFWMLSALGGASLSSWFYLSLFNRYGTFTKFNVESPGFSFSNQSVDFFIPNIEHLNFLFSKPIRPYLNNQFITTLYADLWGDYWGYFSFTSRFLDIGRNQLAMGDYFAIVNILSVFTTLAFAVLCYLTYKKFKESYLIKYLMLGIFFSFFGYLFFTISFPNPSGDTIKSTYIVQFFSLIVFTSSIYFEKLKTMNINIYNFLLFVFTFIYFHNFQTFLSHFPLNYYP